MNERVRILFKLEKKIVVQIVCNIATVLSRLNYLLSRHTQTFSLIIIFLLSWLDLSFISYYVTNRIDCKWDGYRVLGMGKILPSSISSRTWYVNCRYLVLLFSLRFVLVSSIDRSKKNSLFISISNRASKIWSHTCLRCSNMLKLCLCLNQ